MRAVHDRELQANRELTNQISAANLQIEQTEQRRRNAEQAEQDAERIADIVRTPFETLLDDINEIQDVFENTETLDLDVRDEAIDDLLDKFEQAELSQRQLQALNTSNIDATSLQAGELQNEIRTSFAIETNQAEVVSAVDRMREEISRQLRGDRQNITVNVTRPRVFNLPLN